MYWTFWQTAVQENVPSSVLSRVSSYDWLATYAVGPVGYLVAGWLAVLFGAPAALVASATVLLAGTAAVASTATSRAGPTRCRGYGLSVRSLLRLAQWQLVNHNRPGPGLEP
ncbi:hypothetical protein [Salinispora vitiensis]|uniref:hypothetical protein n=1 Tax=Salinispora vitiensis TaxID=999544 RepID=UPI000370EBA4|nr:hypothetical protein [Salinispora vitiensis]